MRAKIRTLKRHRSLRGYKLLYALCMAGIHALCMAGIHALCMAGIHALCTGPLLITEWLDIE
jgi:hypothetical protein